MTVILGGGGEAFPQLTITQSQTWVPELDGNVCIHVVGAGGGGTGYTTYPTYSGGAGAYGKIPTLAVTTSGSYTLVVGVGGIGGNNGNTGGGGGSSTIAGTGLTGTKTCGGGGGAYTSSGSGGSVSGSGESWAGFSGGAGSNDGGGAVGIYATGQAGQPIPAMRGGMTDAQSGGLAMSGFGIICGGSQPSLAQYLLTSVFNYPIQGDDLCGGRPTIYSNNGGYVRCSDGGVGGGGGACRNVASGAYAFGGAGGDGIILIQYLPW